ncbi:MAG: 3-dehydroquinate synthase [Clostridia bacterium]|nr:3-dehydroquinate synthase [Clostridia bacterium]
MDNMEGIKKIHIPAGAPYEVLIGRGLLAETGARVKEVCPQARKIFILTDDRVAELYLDRVASSLAAAGFQVFSFAFPHGEGSKTIETWHAALDRMCAVPLTRSDALVALGGGVTGDMGGFAAACYQRGIDYIQIPTTLLAMVDSSVGGKTAVDLAGGKNQVGAFYQPKVVLCDPDTLNTLPEEEFQAGCAEVIKYGVIGDAEFFHALEATPAKEQVEAVIARCVAAKSDFVMQDERDLGLRMLLNLGHTFGHACEACSGFSILHGQGVAIGMAMMARAATAQGILPVADRDQIIALLKAYGLPTETAWPAARMAEICLADKKTTGDSIRIVVPERIGKCRIEKIPTGDLLRWLQLGGAK